MTGMKQIALDIGLASVASFSNFFAGSNDAALKHLEPQHGLLQVLTQVHPMNPVVRNLIPVL